MIYENSNEYPRLREYLERVSWAQEPGLRVLVGLDYYFKSGFENLPMGTPPPGTTSTADGIQTKQETHQMLDRLSDLSRRWLGLFDNDDDRAKERTPKFFIDFALSRNFRPEWLDWAIGKGLHVPADAKGEAAPVTRNKLRRNSLDPAIDEAIKQAQSTELAAVYLILKAMALDEVMPFTGVLDGGALCYTDDENNPAKLTREALGKRLNRR